MLTPKEVAVLLEGEGYIGSTLTPSGLYMYPSPTVCVRMTGKDSYPKWMYEQFGGLFYHTQARKPEHKDIWLWKVNGRNCDSVLTYVLPEIRIKRTQAKAVLLMITTIGRGKVSDKQLLLRYTLHDLLRRLNKKGPPTTDQVDEVVESLEKSGI